MEKTADLNQLYEFNTRIFIGISFFSLSVILSLFYIAYAHYIYNKPLGLQTLLDLVHVDLAYTYTLCCLALCTTVGLKALIAPPFPHYIALPLSWHTMIRMYTLLLYLTVSSIVRYISVYNAWLLDKFDMSDHFIRNSLYYGTLATSTALATHATIIHKSNE